jgi:hypothetical protein
LPNIDPVSAGGFCGRETSVCCEEQLINDNFDPHVRMQLQKTVNQGRQDIDHDGTRDVQLQVPPDC